MKEYLLVERTINHYLNYYTKECVLSEIINNKDIKMIIRTEFKETTIIRSFLIKLHNIITKADILEFLDDKSAILWFKLEYGG